MGGIEGKQLGGCQILKKLGEGGMGSAYLAHHTRLDRDVVIKILHPHLAAYPGYLQGFQREARAAAKLEHPHIVQVYDCGSEAGVHYIVMQLIDGEDAEDVLKREGKIAPIKALKIIRAALEGLAEAHRHGIIHRDVKPSNILLGKDGTIRLGDFGLAAPASTGQGAGGPMGTPLYMSPEQAVGGAVDARSDIYCMGATLFHLLAGQPPYDAPSAVDVISMHINNPPPDIRHYNPDITNVASQVIMKMMAKNPDERYQSVDAVMTDLNRPGVLMEIGSISGEMTIDIGMKPVKPRPKQAAWSHHTPVPQTAPGMAIPEPEPPPPPKEKRLPRLAAATLLWAAAGACAHFAGIAGGYSVPLDGVAVALAVGAWFAGARHASPMAQTLALLGAAALFGAGWAPAATFFSSTDWRVHLGPLGLALGVFSLSLPRRAAWAPGVVGALLLLMAVGLYIFGLPLEFPLDLMFKPSVLNAKAIPLGMGALLILLFSVILHQSSAEEPVRAVMSLVLVLGGGLAAFAAGGLEYVPARSAPAQDVPAAQAAPARTPEEPSQEPLRNALAPAEDDAPLRDSPAPSPRRKLRAASAQDEQESPAPRRSLRAAGTQGQQDTPAPRRGLRQAAPAPVVVEVNGDEEQPAAQLPAGQQPGTPAPSAQGHAAAAPAAPDTSVHLTGILPPEYEFALRAPLLGCSARYRKAGTFLPLGLVLQLVGLASLWIPRRRPQPQVLEEGL